jgi:hypothetical protein
MVAEAVVTRLKVNLFGESESVVRIHLSAEEERAYRALAEKLRLTLPDALCDPYFYHKLRNPKILSAADLKTETMFSGLLNTPKNQVEVWYAGRKVLKVKINDLINDMVLFPLFQTERKIVNVDIGHGLYLRRREIGLVGHYELYTEIFDIDRLKFVLTEHIDDILLSSLEYEDRDFVYKKSDTLQTFLQAYEWSCTK